MRKITRLLIALVAAIGLISPAAPAFAVDIPVNTAAPTLVGNMAQSRTITVNPGTWTATGAVTKTYLWYACTTSVSAATATLPSDCVAMTATSGWTTFGGQSIYYSYGASNLTLMFLSTVPASLAGKYLAVKETATTATDSAFMITANAEPIAAASSRPTMTTTAATNITTTSATIGGIFVANNTGSQLRMMLSPSSAVSTAAPATNYFGNDFLTAYGSAYVNVGPAYAYGTVPTTAAVNWTNLTPGTTYYYQASTDSYPDIATLSGRYSAGAVMSFTTKNVVVYSTAGSNSGAAPTDSNTYTVGTDLITFKDQGTLAKNGSSFVGWSYGGTTYREGETITAPAGYITFNPVWLSGFTVTYFGNGATSGAAPVESASPYSSASSTVAKTAGALVKTGYDFTGWNTKADGTGTAYAAGATVPVTAAVKLYAQWAPAVAASSTSNAAPVVVAPQVTGFSSRTFTTGSAGSLLVSGNNFANVSSVKVISPAGVATTLTTSLNSSGQLVINVPTATAGTYSLEIRNAEGITTFTNAFVVKVAAETNPANTGVISNVVIDKFAAGSSKLSADHLKSLAATKSLKNVKNITCIGYTEGPVILSTDAALAKARATAACGVLKKIFGTQVTYQTSGATTANKGAAIRRVEIVFGN